MTIQTFVTLYFISVPIFFIIDMIWLGFVASSFYKNQLGAMMQVSWTPAIAFYLMYLVGLIIFAVYPGVLASSWKVALGYGALFGFFTYATYEMTNLATLKDWPLTMVPVDILWGTVLGASVSALTYYLYSLI